MIAVECPKCKGSLHVDQEVEKIFCMYCRAAVTVKKPESNVTASEALIKRGFLLVEHRDWEKALEVFDKAANVDPENAQIYLGMLLAETRTIEEASLKAHSKSLSNYPSYQKAIKFADSALRERLEAYHEIVEQKRQDELAKQKEEINLTDLSSVLRGARLSGGGASLEKIALSVILSIIITDVVSFFIHGELRLVNLNIFRSWSNLNRPGWTVVMFFFVYLVLLYGWRTDFWKGKKQ